MTDFQFLQNPVSKQWNILAPRRVKRTNENGVVASICPLCIGRENEEEELYRVGGKEEDTNWQIRVIANKFPFTPHHELIIHSPDHHKNIDELPVDQVELLLQTYRHRYNANKHNGQVLLFHNRGHGAGESLPHPHTQLAVVPSSVKFEAQNAKSETGFRDGTDTIETDFFHLFCPATSEWPDEVWIAPRRSGDSFGAITDEQVHDLAFVLSRVIQLLDLRHGAEFPFNFYISPENNWYLRIIPRQKILGGFELATGIIVNTQDPSETFAFFKEHFWQPDREAIKSNHQAEYWRRS